MCIRDSITPVRNPQYVVLSDGSLRNTYDLRLLNKHGEDHWFAFSATTNNGEVFVLALEGEAVSYTHLDVYKRQVLRPAARAFAAWVLRESARHLAECGEIPAAI